MSAHFRPILIGNQTRRATIDYGQGCSRFAAAFFSPVEVLITQIRDCITRWNATAVPFVWSYIVGEIMAEGALPYASFRKLVDNHA